MTQIMVQLDAKNVVVGYGICLNDQHEPIPNGIKITTDLNINDINFNYKLIDGILIELEESEKPIIEPSLSELEKIRLEMARSNAEMFEMMVSMMGGGM